MITKQFISTSLQGFSDEADLVISKHLQDLDRVSNDIKTLESKLKLAGIPFNFNYILDCKEKRCSEPTSKMNDVYEDYSYMGDFIHQIEECLLWGKNESGEYRLWFATYVAIDEIEQYNHEGQLREKYVPVQNRKLSSRRPLIETKSHLRLRVEKELPIFYKKIIEALKNNRDQGEVSIFSPNHTGLPF